ncbi:hypothetical protein [Frigidibacter sp. ROC022]|uniref:hypothetical protein n=1 Tax=Frigidibacter sp. ROC022 TaxID=2971796 RepID=UPI00215AB5BF|nr:hypothetical protein [Frigidibacter sp. ROC022]MCR8723272.1 hypothetical protein [Frigidibacter sp. ROC022]
MELLSTLCAVVGVALTALPFLNNANAATKCSFALAICDEREILAAKGALA